MNLTLSIVIVNWNTRALLRECLASIQKTVHRPGTEVWVVDNASIDGSVEMVRKEFPGVAVLENAQNVGFARANNQAVRRCRGEAILLLNSDTLVLAGAIDHLIEFMTNHPEVAAVGPRLVDSQRRTHVMVAGYLPTVWTVFSHFFFLSALWPRVFSGLSLSRSLLRGGPIRVEWLSGACLVVRKDVFLSLGGLAETYFMYAEDIEFCERMTQAGHELYCIPAAQVVHLVGASSRGLPVAASTQWVRSLHRFFARNHSRASVIAFDLIHGVGLGIRTVAYHALSLGPDGSEWSKKARLVGASSRQAFALAAEMLSMSRRTPHDQ